MKLPLVSNDPFKDEKRRQLDALIAEKNTLLQQVVEDVKAQRQGGVKP